MLQTFSQYKENNLSLYTLSKLSWCCMKSNYLVCSITVNENIKLKQSVDVP